MVGQYTKQLSKSFKNLSGKVRFLVHFKGGNTVKNLLVVPNDRVITQKNKVIYRCRHDKLDCDEEYIGESVRTFGERLKENLRAPSPIYDPAKISGHHTNVDNSIVGREVHNITRTIKEAMYIRVNDSSLTGKLSSSNCPIYGMRSCSTPLPSTTSNSPSVDLTLWSHLPLLYRSRCYTACVVPTALVWSCTRWVPPHPLAQCINSHIH